MNRWYRQSLPPGTFVYALLIAVLVTDLIAAAAWLAWGHGLEWSESFVLLFPSMLFNVLFCAIAGGCIALYRSQRFPEPWLNKHFHSWLASTPWTPSTRTPFGPWHPVVLDVIPLGLLGLIAAAHAAVLVPALIATQHPPADWLEVLLTVILPAALTPAVAFFLFWTFCAYFSVCGRWNWSVYALALWVGVLFHIERYASLSVALASLAASLVVIMVASWRRMAFELTQLPTTHLASSNKPAKPRQTATTYAALSPSPQLTVNAAGLAYLRAKAIAAGLLVFVWLTIHQWDPVAVLFFPIVLFVLCLARMVVYGEKCVSHLGLIARWSTRQFIVPAYDRVFIPSVVMIVAGLAILGLVQLGVLPVTLGGALSIAVPVVIGLAMGPDYTTWSLTAPCRYSRRQQQQRR